MYNLFIRQTRKQEIPPQGKRSCPKLFLIAEAKPPVPGRVIIIGSVKRLLPLSHLDLPQLPLYGWTPPDLLVLCEQ